jgi:hypothetical protein
LTPRQAQNSSRRLLEEGCAYVKAGKLPVHIREPV